MTVELRACPLEPDPTGGRVTGVHHGYERLDDPVTHERNVHLDTTSRSVTIEDRLTCRGQHTARIYFHFDSACSVDQDAAGHLTIRSASSNLTMTFEDRVTVTLLTGSDAPKAGWQSRRYHHLEPTTTAIGTFPIDGESRLTTKIEWTT